MSRFTETIAALATPVGTAAIAVVRASGPETARIARDILGKTPPPRMARHTDYRGLAGDLLDDVLVVFFRGPHSYTGEDCLEISCHGNPFIAQKILEDLFARGCRPAQPGEFTQRAFLHGKMDLSQAEAVMDLISARSERALTAANQQLRGALGRRIRELVDQLVNVIARVEAYIDFPEEDLPTEDREGMKTILRELLRETEQLRATSHYGELLHDGIKVVIVGAPNAGKSCVFNRLVGQDRALVSAEPGTTRDFLEERITVGPHLVRLIDTAGLNEHPSPLEKLGMEKTMELVAATDLLLLVLDATDTMPNFPSALLSRLSRKNTLILLNKCDMPTDGTITQISSKRAEHEPISLNVSARYGTNFEALLSNIELLACNLQPESDNRAFAINGRHHDALVRVQQYLSTALDKLADGTSAELLASDLRSALACLGEIIGTIENDRILDALFGHFCIGK